MRPHVILALLSVLAVFATTGATVSFSSLTDDSRDLREIAEFAVTAHNQLVLPHQLKLVSVDRFQSKVLIRNFSVIYTLVLTTADTVGVAKQRYEAVVQIVNLNLTGQSYKQLVSFLPKLT